MRESGRVVLRPGVSQACVEVTVRDDSDPESPETFSIEFSFDLPPNAPPVPPISTMVTIIDNDMGMREGLLQA